MDNNVREIWKGYKEAIANQKRDFTDIYSHLRRQKPGTDGWVTACCPLHDDHEPSFAFHRVSGRWACFARCGKGNVFDFLMLTTGQSFKDVLFGLGDKIGIPRPSTNGHHPHRIDSSLVKKMAEDLAKHPSAMRYLKEKRGLTDETIKSLHLGFDKLRGRIAIPIFDEKKRVVNIRFYSPTKTPKMQNLKGFGTPVRLYGLDELVSHQGKEVILCEGEFDRILLRQNGFMAVTTTHGCTFFKPELALWLKGKDVVVIYDNDAEGQAAVEAVVLKSFKGSGVTSVKNVRLPVEGTKEDKDISDFFTKIRPIDGDLFNQRRFNTDDLRKLINEAPAFNLEAFVPGVGSDNGKGPNLLAIVNSLRNADHLKAHERNSAISEATGAHLGKIGGFFFDSKSPEEFLCVDSQVYMVGNNRGFNTLLQDLGRFNITTPEGRFVWEFLRNFARKNGTPIKSTSWVFGDSLKSALYVHTHNEQGQILKIAPGSIQLLPNGQNDDKILLNPSDRTHPFTFLERQDIGQGLALLKALVYDTAPCSEADRAFLIAYAVAIFLRDFCTVKPLLRLGGPHGTGKTSITTSVSYVIYGENVGKSATMAANYTDASKNPLTILDNKEARDIDKDTLNFLLTGSTGITYEKRKLYENQDIVREKANCFTVTSGIESLGKPELISRQWDILCDRSYFKPDFSVSDQIEKLTRHRDEILSAIFKLISTEILPALKRRPDFEIALHQKFPDHPKARTFDCLALILIIWDALERLLGLPSNLDEQWVEAQCQSSEEHTQETDLFVQFLDLFRSAAFTFKEMGVELKEFERRPYFDATSMQLHTIFSHLARQHGFPQPFVSAKQLGERLWEAIPVLKRIGWDVQMRVRIVVGKRYHRFFPPADSAN